MKKLLAIAVAVIVSTAVFAQNDKKADSTIPATSTAAEVAAHDCYTMKNNALMHCTGNNNMEFQKTDVKLKNGATLTAKGEVKKADGTKEMITNGQCITLDGKIGNYDKMHAEMTIDKKADDKMMEAKPADVK